MILWENVKKSQDKGAENFTRIQCRGLTGLESERQSRWSSLKERSRPYQKKDVGDDVVRQEVKRKTKKTKVLLPKAVFFCLEQTWQRFKQNTGAKLEQLLG